jgi:hypothetical protein
MTIQTFTYEDGWYAATTARLPLTAMTPGTDPDGWSAAARPSTARQCPIHGLTIAEQESK